MAVAFVNANSGTNGSSTDWTVNLPASLAAGDVIVLAIATETVHTIGASPSGGWTTVVSQAQGGTDSTVTVMWRRATGSEGATETITGLFVDVEGGAHGTSAYRGVVASPTNPVNTFASAANGGSPISGPSITPTVNGCMILHVCGGDHTSTTTHTPDSSPVADERFDIAETSGSSVFLQDYLQATAAAIALDATMSSSLSNASVSLALEPDGGGGGGGTTLRLLGLLGCGT